MAYFDRLRKRARNQSGWSGYMYTGNSAAGADLVSEDTWCVVYTADVHYQSERERLNSLTVSTNFVNPLSSGNPCTVSCYLYTFDPTSNGSAGVSAPPAGFYSAVSRNFEASTVGHFVSFTFSTLDIRPSQVYLWFTSTVSYESYGSNSIYHYATGNYSSGIGSGTRTPTLTGSFTGSTSDSGGSGGGGGSIGGLYTAVASGSYSSLYAQRDFSYSRSQYSASYTALSFASGGNVEFSCQNSSGDKYLEMRGYLTIGSGFDSVRGVPTGSIVAQITGRESYSFTAQVSSSQTYYLWTVIDYCGSASVPLTVTISPAGWNYTIVDQGSSTLLPPSERSFSMSMGVFQTGRMMISFDYSGQIHVDVGAADGAFSGLLYISTQPDIDSQTGSPLTQEAVFRMGYSVPFSVERGVPYFFFAIYNGGSSAGSIHFTIAPPTVLWIESGSNSFSMLDNAEGVKVSLGPFCYHHIRTSFAHNGIAHVATGNAQVGDGRIWLYMCREDRFDTYRGLPVGYENFFTGNSYLDANAFVIAGQTYHFFIRNQNENLGLSGDFVVYPPEAALPYFKELENEMRIEEDTLVTQNLRYFSFNENILSFKYHGEIHVSGIKAQGQENITVQLRAYLCTAPGIDRDTGVPTGPIIDAYIGDGESFSLNAQVQEDTPYYLYIVSSEIYGNLTADLTLFVASPPAQYFSVTQTAEYYAISQSLLHSASPGESGVLRLELSFDRSGIAHVDVQPTGGNYDYLIAYLAHTPYLDALTGAPFQESLLTAPGSETSPGPSFDFTVQKDSTYYLFVRCSGVYDAANFDVHINCKSAALNLYTQEKHLKAQPFVYHQGAWYPAVPLCLREGSWHIGG